MQNFQGAKTKKSILKLARLCRRFLLLDLTFAPFNFNVRHVAFRSAVAPRSVALRDFFFKVLRLESCVFFAYQRYFGFRFFLLSFQDVVSSQRFPSEAASGIHFLLFSRGCGLYLRALILANIFARQAF
jgi:hypothetical protein